MSQVLTGGESRPQPLWFPLNPRYWIVFKDGGSWTRRLRARLVASTEQTIAGLDSDVAAEIEAVHNQALPPKTTVQILGLWKSYKSNCGRKVFSAVKGVSYAMQEGCLFALLGHNGAGKTTTIKMVTAQSNPTDGDATMHGLSVSKDAEKVRKFLGICPQHDILYHELSAWEHLWLYGALKGLTKSVLAQNVPSLLKHVKLDRVATKQARARAQPSFLAQTSILLSPFWFCCPLVSGRTRFPPRPCVLGSGGHVLRRHETPPLCRHLVHRRPESGHA